jgi:hypothetical protein
MRPQLSADRIEGLGTLRSFERPVTLAVIAPLPSEDRRSERLERGGLQPPRS